MPPSGYDDLHVPSNKPQISINSPQNNSSVGYSFSASVKTSAPRGVSRVEYFIDGNLITTANYSPFSATINLSSGASNGFHTLKAVSYDDIDNSNEHEININVTSSGITNTSSGSFVWISPKENSIISSFPINITFNAENADSISLWHTKKGKANYYKIGEITNPNGYSSLSWENPGEAGTYTIKAIIKKLNNTTEEDLEVEVK